MLVQFKVQNYRSYRDEVTLSMVASSLTGHPDHIVNNCGLNLLRTGVIFGSNAGGKTNLFKALMFMKHLVFSSHRRPSTSEIEAEPFLLDRLSASEPSFFEIVFISDECLYRYGFMVTTELVAEEWLYVKECSKYAREVMVFKRKKDDVEFSAQHILPEDMITLMKNSLRKNALLISFLDQFNQAEAVAIVRFFQDVSIDLGRLRRHLHLSNVLKRGIVPHAWIERFVQAADLGIDRLEVTDLNDQENMNNEYVDKYRTILNRSNSFTVSAVHNCYDAESDSIFTENFDLMHHESAGTNRFVDIAIIIYPVLKKGGVLMIDEIDNSMHYFLTRIVIELFQNKKTNPKHAQLIFTTHDIIHLDRHSFRRDEIWFVDKDYRSSSKLYSLAEFRVRKDASYDLDYLRGKYRAIPNVDFEKFAKLLNGDDNDE